MCLFILAIEDADQIEGPVARAILLRHDGILDRNAIGIGTPHFGRWKEQVLRDDGADIDHDLVGVFSRIEEWRTLPA